MHGWRNIGSSGDYLNDTKNAKDCFIGYNIEDCRFCSFITGKLTDTYDFTNFGEKLHSEPFFGSMQQLVGFKEYIKLLEDEKHDLEVKLNLKHEESMNFNKENSAHYEIFTSKIKEINSENSSSSLRTIVQTLDLCYPKIIFQSLEASDNIVFMLDLRNRYDRQIYFVACALFLEYRKSKDLKLFLQVYQSVFPEHIDVPKSLEALKNLFNHTPLELYMSAYRIEELIHYFEKLESPKVNPSIDIDQIFGLSTYSVFKTRKNEDEGIRLKNMFAHLLFFEKARNELHANPYGYELSPQ